MAPTALPQLHRDGEQDTDLTYSALEHKEAEDLIRQKKISGSSHPAKAEANGHSNGVAVNGSGRKRSFDGAVKPAYQELDASLLETILASSPQPVPTQDYIDTHPALDTVCTDHMVSVTWSAASGWGTPRLAPVAPLSISPTASVLHYATECFEGLKAYRSDYDGKLRLFRPDRNCARMVESARRISLPTFPAGELRKLVEALVALDGKRWLPPLSAEEREKEGGPKGGRYLYLRPTLIGTQAQLGVQAPREALLFVTASLMPRMDSSSKPAPTSTSNGNTSTAAANATAIGMASSGGMRLHTSPDDMVRAWVGGFGFAKVGANYGPSLLATREARARGYTQVLWLYGKDGECTEAGASNFFVLWRAPPAEGGRLQLVTAPLDDRLILDGVTRRSVLELARERLQAGAEFLETEEADGPEGRLEQIEIVERKYTIAEVVRAHEEGRIVEAFASGTAVSHLPLGDESRTSV